MVNQIKHKSPKRKFKWLLGIYIFMGIIVYLRLYFGICNFLTTTFTYSLIALFFYFIIKLLKLKTNAALAIYSCITCLFLAEFTIRYIIRNPLSYGEQNGGNYILTDRYMKLGNLKFIYLNGRKDVHTLEYDPGEIQGNSNADFKFKDYSCNALGLRGPLPKKGKKVIVVAGDSFTQGIGTPDDSTISELLRKHLASLDSSLDIINAGVAGNDIFFDWKMIHKLSSKYPIKKLIFIVNSTDITDVADRGGSERFCDNGMLKYKSRPWWEPIYAVSFISRLMAHNVANLNYSLISDMQVRESQVKAINQISGLIENEIMPWTVERDIDLTIVVHPLMSDFDSSSNTIYRQLIDTLHDIPGLHTVDCMPALKEEKDITNLYWPHDKHFKPYGYNIISNIVIDSCYR